GGADSVALLAALCALGCSCVAAHCNFRLRGAESARDMRSARELCAELGVDCYIKEFDVDARRKATGESVEMACRELRYAWFADLLDKLRAQCIAVAHHSEDNVESFFLNLLRGSGLAGLTGMRWRNGYVARPMLGLTRPQIEEYLADKELPFVVDSTNASNEYKRNRLRNVVIPCIDKNFPGGMAGIHASISHLADNRRLYDALLEQKRGIYINGASINLVELVASEPEPRILLYELIKPLGFNMTHAEDIIASSGRSGLAFRAGDTALELDRGVLHIRASKEAEQGAQCVTVSLRRDILVPAHILISEHAVAEFKPERNPNVAYFDIAIMDGDPEICLRHWRRGDRISPFGEKASASIGKASSTGTRLVSDLYANAKYSAADKRAAWLLTRNGEILWAVGLRPSSLFTVNPETRRYLRLEYRP
ncbi:MAG: tRNA lysidine(34) synthetase TilS, partial [Clostridium sp.]|nr:tRNA lysidine(34) synthetase TilS [Clostridium sp.]